MTPGELFQAGRLTAAVDAAIADVKQHPTDFQRRFLLAELLSFQGDLERADKQLDTVMQQTTDGAMRVTLMRQLLRAETARRQFFSEGRVPEVVAEPTEALRLQWEASLAMRDGQSVEAARLLEQAESLRHHPQGTHAGQAFDDCRDCDDLLGGFLEVLTGNGKYYWVPLDRIRSLEFQKPERPMDLLWRSALIDVQDGPEGSVYVPTIYVDTLTTQDEQLKLGRGTDWAGDEGGPTRGLGQRTLLVGDQAIPLLQLHRLEFVVPESPDTEQGEE